MTQQEQINLVNELIIDNNIMAVNPAKVRAVLTAIIMSQTPSPSGSFNAVDPLQYDAFSSTISLPPINYQARRLKAKGGNELPGLRPGDVVEGWSPDGKSWWDSAVYNGGDITEEGSYTVIVGTQVIA